MPKVVHEDRALFLSEEGGEGLRVIDACPNRPFMPFALLLWGARIDTFVRQLRVDSVAQLVGPVQGFEFEADLSFDEFRALCSPRADLLMPAIELEKVGHLAPLCLPIVDTGGRVELTVEGPVTHAVLVGQVPRVVKAAA